MTAGDQAIASGVVQIKPSVRIALLGGFDLIVNDVPVAAPVGSRRLLAFVALNYRAPVPRPLLAGSLWPKVPEHCAHTNLRAALCRLRGLGTRALDITPTDVRLASDVTVDLRDARMLAQHLLDPCVPPVALSLSTATVDQLSADLLPGWYDEWALLEADHWRQLRLHALESLTETFIDATEYAGAVVAAQAAVRADPLRESSQASLIRAYLAEGNPSEAVHHFERYVRRLRDELGLCPTQRLHQLVARVRYAGDGDAALRR